MAGPAGASRGAASTTAASRVATHAASANGVAKRRFMASAPSQSLRESHQDRHGAVIFEGIGSDAPDYVIVRLRAVHGHLVIGTDAAALVADARAAAIPIRHQIRALIGRIDAAADPGRRRRLRAGRTGMHTAAAAGAQVAIDTAIAPVIAGRVVLRLRLAAEIGTFILIRGARALHGQQREGRRCHQHRAESRQCAASGKPACQTTRQPFAPVVNAESLHGYSPRTSTRPGATICVALSTAPESGSITQSQSSDSAKSSGCASCVMATSNADSGTSHR